MLKLFAIAVLASGLVIGIFTAGNIKQDDAVTAKHPPAQEKIKWHARQARLKGKKEVTLLPPAIDYAGGAVGLNEALSFYTVVVAQPVAEKSVSLDGNTVSTWYKIKVIEVLSHGDGKCPVCPSFDPPDDMLPLNKDELFVNKLGGAIQVDGVKVITHDPSSAPLSFSNKYLFFLSIEPSGVATIGGGPAGIFHIDDEEKIRALTDHSALKRDIDSRLGRSLSKLKEHLSTLKQ